LDVDTIQLLTTSIPQANASIPNTAIAFWYYRLSNYSGTTPSLNNLYCVRLLPSYYKPEFISNPTTYGFNKTFSNYTSLATELAKSCTTDLGYYNLENYLKPIPDGEYDNLIWPFLPGEISLTYNPTYNKFQMTGNTTKLAYIQWSGATTYALNDVVFLDGKAYTSLANSNTNHTPASSPTFWKQTNNEIVAEWVDTTRFITGNIVRYNGALYYLPLPNTSTLGVAPPTLPGVAYTQDIEYRYLITGYDDPNVAILQGRPSYQ
jgi:hypothetical protein